MIIECPYCEAHVAGKVLAQHDSYHPDEDPGVFTAVLLECPKCSGTLLAGYYTFREGTEEFTDKPARLWPAPPRYSSWSIPAPVRASLEEADRCFRAGAFIACAAMCGRAIEAICREHGEKTVTLGPGLKALRDKQIIDGRLFEWASELQKTRNLTAHATDEKVSKDDARDLLDFTHAICDYVYVFSAKFEAFKKRKISEPLAF